MKRDDPPFIEYEGRLVTANTKWWHENRDKGGVKAAGLKHSLMCKHRVALHHECPDCKEEVAK